MIEELLSSERLNLAKYNTSKYVNCNVKRNEFFFKQRQKLREIILQQQQQKKNAVRQEKALQEQAATPHATPLQHWQQDNLNPIFNRPPPPYPGNIRSSVVPPGGPRFPVYPKDQRGPFPGDGQFNRPQFPGDMNAMGMRPHGLR